MLCVVSQSAARGPGRPRVGSEDKRERILREAARLFSGRGYAETSLADVAGEAEISKAGLLHHFGSKEGLFSAVLERRDADDLVVLAGEDGDLWDFLDRFVAVIEKNASRPGIVRLYAVMSMGALDRDHPAHPWLHQHLTRGVAHMAEQFERGKVEGLIAVDAPSLELSRMLHALADGVQLQWLCARTDAAADPGPSPLHDDIPLEMAAQVRSLVEMIKTRWGRD